MRRKTKDDIIRGIPYGSLGYYPNQPETGQEEFAGAISTPRMIRRYNGVSAIVNIWANPTVGFKEYSAVAIGMREGNRNWCRAGIMVNPLLFEDEIPHLFISWKNASNHGCFNGLCDGFVQMSENYGPGSVFDDFSVFKGLQTDVQLTIYRDNVQGNWKLKYLDEIIGYWPQSLFGSRFRSNAVAEWTGIVLNSRDGGVHTSTAMGNGRFPSPNSPCSDYKKVAYLGKMRVIDAELSYRTPDLPLTFVITHHFCYSADVGAIRPRADENGLRIYYGGPGGAGCDAQ